MRVHDVKTIDIDRLHRDILSQTTERNSGVTLRMLVDVIHHTEFLAGDMGIVVLCGNNDNANRLNNECCRIARALGFDPCRVTQHRVRINLTAIDFVGQKDSPWLDGKNIVVFEDEFLRSTS